MEEYILKSKALEELHLNHSDVIYIDKQEAAERIRKIPAIDIVHCEKCARASDWKILGICDIWKKRVRPNFYCGFGARKDNDG